MLPVLTPEMTQIRTLGPKKIDSPLEMHQGFNASRRVRYYPFAHEDDCTDPSANCHEDISFEVSVPHPKIFFDPKKARAAIVTCGGICPGLNDVIRSIVIRLWHGYGVKNIVGIRFGLRGLVPKYGFDFMELTPKVVSSINELGGTILGSSRGGQSMEDIVDTLERQNINMLFVIGGDGSLRAAGKIEEEVKKRGLMLSVIGIPKTIDNDISFVSRSFGFESAVEMAGQAIKGAHTEAKAFPNGVGLVKLMGRESGYIAANASLAQSVVNVVLIPEVDFDLDGPEGLFAHLEKRLAEKHHVVIVVAEGSGQKYFEKSVETDASGNKKLEDIGSYLKNRIIKHFSSQQIEINLKYIDPSYMIRSVPANTNDGLYCATLGQNAVHAAMAGCTGMLVSLWHGVYCRIPLDLVTEGKKRIIPAQGLWQNVLETTGQPSFINPKK